MPSNDRPSRDLLCGPGPDQRLDRAVTIWLWVIVGCVFAMVLVGGATRLTESGLSITEWRPVEGVIPPLSRADWLGAFANYRATSQFVHLFPDMTLDQFKRIFMWEWSHRLLGRLIGLILAAPLVWFWLRGQITPTLGRKLLAVLALGGLQGLIGWLMVKSGLTHRVEVAPEMLAAHLLLASTLLILVVAIAAGPPAYEPKAPARLRAFAAALPFLVLGQIGLGGLVAGARAGFVYNTWPLMAGSFAPSFAALTRLKPLWANWFENAAAVQFDHRMMAYALLAVAVWHAVDAKRAAPKSALARRAAIVAAAVTVQASIGIMTLLLVVPLWAGLLHQGFAMAVLIAATLHWRRSRSPRAFSLATPQSLSAPLPSGRRAPSSA